MKSTLRILAVSLQLSALSLIALQSACTHTITPQRVEAVQPSFDQGDQTSGILSVTDIGAIITNHARLRYDLLADKYGHAFQPAIAAGYGLTDLHDGTWLITNEALEKWLVMADWQRMGRAAP